MGFLPSEESRYAFSLTTRMQQVFWEFFELPYEQWNKIRAEAEEDALPDEGYGDRFGGKRKKSANWSVRLRLYTFPVSERRYELWPTHPPSFRETVENYCEETDKLVRLILELILEGLGLETLFLNDYFAGKSQQVLQVNYYPPCPQPDVTMGLIAECQLSLVGKHVLMQVTLCLVE